MKTQDFFRFFRPLNVLVAGALGGGILALMFSPYFPVHCQSNVMTFFCAPEFSVMFFLMGILSSLMAIALFPGWGIFAWLLKTHMTENQQDYRSKAWMRLATVVIVIAVISYADLKSLNQFSPEAQSRWDADVPNGVQLILLIHAVYFIFAILPYLLGMFLLSALIRNIGTKADTDVDTLASDSVFGLIRPLLLYRRMLQLFLLVSGIMLSLFPLSIVELRSILIKIDPLIGSLYPASYAIFQSLIFTMLLLFIYVPAYLELTVVGRRLRDVIYPLCSLDTLKDTVEKRKTLDNLLQTEGPFITNLSSSMLTLSPLISSLLVLLGIKI